MRLLVRYAFWTVVDKLNHLGNRQSRFYRPCVKAENAWYEMHAKGWVRYPE